MVQIKSSDFNEDHLKLGGVWAWSSDPKEAEYFLVSVPLTEESLSEVESLLIHANFVTADGDLLRGLIVYSMGSADVFAIEILDGEKKFTFNKFARDISRNELIRLAECVGKDAAKLLPISYEIAVRELSIPAGFFTF